MYLNSLYLPTIRVFTNITSNTCLSFFLKLFTKLSVNIKKVSTHITVHTLRSTELEYTYSANTVEVSVENYQLTHHKLKWFPCWKRWQNFYYKNILLVEWGCGLYLQSPIWLQFYLRTFRCLMGEVIHNLQGFTVITGGTSNLYSN